MLMNPFHRPYQSEYTTLFIKGSGNYPIEQAPLWTRKYEDEKYIYITY